MHLSMLVVGNASRGISLVLWSSWLGDARANLLARGVMALARMLSSSVM